MEEIKATIAKYDLGAMVVIHEPGFSEWFHKLDPKYTALRVNKEQIKLELNPAHYKGDLALRDQRATNACNLMQHLTKGAAVAFNKFDPIRQFLNEKLNAEHDDGKLTNIGDDLN